MQRGTNEWGKILKHSIILPGNFSWRKWLIFRKHKSEKRTLHGQVGHSHAT